MRRHRPDYYTKRLLEIEERHSKATPGPWHRNHEAVLSGASFIALVGCDPGRNFSDIAKPNEAQIWADTRFITASWSDIRVLLDEIRYLKSLISNPEGSSR